MYYECFTCRIIVPLLQTAAAKCIRCGSTQGELIADESFYKGFNHGAYYNFDIKTGRRAEDRHR